MNEYKYFISFSDGSYREEWFPAENSVEARQMADAYAQYIAVKNKVTKKPVKLIDAIEV